MGYSVQERAEHIGTYRWIEIQSMEMLARWIPSTPEMEIKILFGRHVWECAQRADALGKRAFELRAPLHFTLPAIDAFAAFLREVEALASTADRVGAFYDVICPRMSRQYRGYLDNTDALMDEPTVRILDDALRGYDRMAAERQRLARELPRALLDSASWLERLDRIGDPVAHGERNKRARGIPA